MSDPIGKPPGFYKHHDTGEEKYWNGTVWMDGVTRGWGEAAKIGGRPAKVPRSQWTPGRTMFAVVFIGSLLVLAVAFGSDNDSRSSSSNLSASDTTAGSVESSGLASNQPVDDVDAGPAIPDTYAPMIKSTVTITNHGSKRSDYVIRLVLSSRDGSSQCGTDTELVNSLDPGQTTTKDAVFFHKAEDVIMVVKLLSVSRHASY